MSDAKPRHTTTIEALIKALPNRIFKRDALAVGVTLLLGAGGYAYAQKLAQDRIESAAERKVAPIKKTVEELQLEVRDLKAQVQANEARAAERFDVLYRTMLTGRRDSRAEELATPAPPAKDGGQ